MTGAETRGRPPQPWLIVVGMNREARIARVLGPCVIGGRGGLEAAIAQHQPGGLISFGLCGALAPGLKPGDLVISDLVRFGREVWAADPDWTAALAAALPQAHIQPMAGSLAMVPTVRAKAALRRATSAAAVDMETLAVARAAAQARLPFAVVRAVSDAAERTLPDSARKGFRPDGSVDVLAVIAALARRPKDLPDLLRVAREAEAGFKALSLAAAALAGVQPNAK